MYRAPAVVEMRHKVTGVVMDLFPLFLENPALLPASWQPEVEAATGKTGVARVVADYVSGMTDRFALQEHERLTGGR
jgi:dGTPase